MCFSCGKCCHNHSIMITFSDLRQIHRNRPDIFLPQIITIFETHPDYEDLSVLKEFHPEIKIEEDGRVVKGYLGLRFMKTGNIDGNEIEDVCQLFDEKSKSCTIHSFKPMSCKIYPHYLEGERIYWNNGRCPEKWDISKENIEEVRNLIKKAKKNHLEFVKEVEEWNKKYKGKTQEDFFNFVLF